MWNGVGNLLNKHFSRVGIMVHDLMHKAALTDTKMRNPDAKDQAPGHREKFAWLNTLTISIGASVEFIQWRLEWAHYFRIYSGTIVQLYHINIIVKFIISFNNKCF